MKQIVCLSNTPWSSSPSRTQQLLTRLPGTDILFFEPPARQGRANNSKGRKVRPNVMVYQLPDTIRQAAQVKLIARYNRRKIADFIDKTMARHRFHEPLLWCTTPEDAQLLDYLAYRGLVYDCQRYWSNLPLEWEGELAASADVCFVASDGLADRLSTCSGNIVLLPNGNNFPLFRRENPDTPPELADLAGKPVFGYSGPLYHDLIVTPLLMAADEHPEWTFLLIGPVKAAPYLPQLEARNNIRILGKRPPVDLPDYFSCCKVCFNLLRRSDEDSDVIPSRIYEYLAAGKPVVSMLWPHQMQEFPDVVRPARTPEVFVEQCAAALREDPAETLRRRRDYGAAAAWDARAEEVMRILEVNGLHK